MILFLDFDGVLHPLMRREPDFCRLPFLHQILRACPNANAVFSTSWREIYRPDEMVEFVTRAGGEDLAHRFIGQTPRLHARSDYDPRLLECLRWLESNGHADSSWLALDDIPQNFNSHPNLYLVDRTTGLTEADVAAIIQRIQA
jgi:hypothetical protein